MKVNVSIEKMLENFDRAKFGCAMRKIELLLCREDTDRARRVFDDLVRDCGKARLSLSSSVWEVYPYRIAGVLESRGYETVAAAGRASEADLLRSTQMGRIGADIVRTGYQAIAAGRRPPVWDQESDLANLEPDWPAPTVDEVMGSVKQEETKVETVAEYKTNGSAGQGSAVQTALSKAQQVVELLTSGSELLPEIDAEISRVEAQLDELRRVRRLLGKSASTPGSRSRSMDGDEDLIGGMVELLGSRGPMSVAELSREAGLHHMTTRRLIATSGGKLAEKRGKVYAA